MKRVLESMTDAVSRRINHRLAQRKGLSVAGEPGCRSEFWRELSWRLGDEHTNRLCWLVDGYCRVFGVERERFHGRVPK